MPEGDTIFRTARTLHRALANAVVSGFQSTYAELTRAADETTFVGQRIERVESRGKWVLMTFSSHDGKGERCGEERILATHMLMSGSWHIYRTGEAWQLPADRARIVIRTAEYEAVGFRVPVARVHTPETLRRDRKIPRAAEDVLADSFDASAAADRLLKRTEDRLADALLNQRVMAGVGNVFKSEICFLLGMSPFRGIGTLSRMEAEAVIATARRLLAANVLEDSGDRMVTYRGRKRRTTHAADPGASLWVYGRKGEACRRCGTAIERSIEGPDARSTYWCPECQPRME